MIPGPRRTRCATWPRDAAALARELDDRPALLAGIGVGGMVAQVAALDHPDVFSALTLVGTRPVAPGPVDDDLPDHDAEVLDARVRAADARLVRPRGCGGPRRPRAAAILGDDPTAARVAAGRKWDRTPGRKTRRSRWRTSLDLVFAALDCQPRWRERLPELPIPALVVHGRHDRFFPLGNGEALAREIRGARLLVLEQSG